MNAVQESPDAFGRLREDSSITIRANIVPPFELGDLSEISGTKGQWVHYELPSTAGVMNEKPADRQEFYMSSFEPGLYIAYDLEKADEERMYTEKMLDYYCVKLQRYTPMLHRDRGSVTPVLEIEGILVQKVVVPPPPPSEDTYRRIGIFYYRGPATPFGYNFDIKNYKSTFEEMAEETDEETEEPDEWSDHGWSEESDGEYEESEEWYKQKEFDRQRRLEQRLLKSREKPPPWNEKEVKKGRAKIMQRRCEEGQMQDRNKQRYNDAWIKDIEYKQITLI